MLFRTALELVEELELEKTKGELNKKVSQLSKGGLLIIDELVYLTMTRQAQDKAHCTGVYQNFIALAKYECEPGSWAVLVCIGCESVAR